MLRSVDPNVTKVAFVQENDKVSTDVVTAAETYAEGLGYKIVMFEGYDSGYGDVQILRGVSLRLETGRLTSLVGGNGVGKTTLLRAVMGGLKTTPLRSAVQPLFVPSGYPKQRLPSDGVLLP